jgi:hypothetical protein
MAVENDLKTAQAVAKSLGNPFPIGTCGWVLGPQQNRAAWDQLLANDAPIANINPQAGHAAIDSGFSMIKNRPKWAIPWLENDPDMVGYQPWVGRMRYDAADALRRGCTGLMGIHWRTKILSQNIAALAQAGWDQSWASSQRLLDNPTPEADLRRAMPADDFYRDFARAHFGDAVAESAGSILADADGFTTGFNPKKPDFVATSEWAKGPGGLRSVREPWEKMRTAHYLFAEKFAALRPRVKGAGNRERFDYWMNTHNASARMMQLACLRGELDVAVEKMNAAKNPAAKKKAAKSALALRRQLVRGWESLIRLQIQLVSTPGELGTIANLEQHSRVNNQWLTLHDKSLAAALGAPLPADCAPSRQYAGPARLIVPTVRSVANKGESLKVKIIAVDKQPVKSVVVHQRPLGKGDWQTIPAKHVARAVYEARLPAAQDDFEYYITAGKDLVWPATAPQLNQTVVVAE